MSNQLKNKGREDLRTKEEEYKRLNEELEAKTAALVQTTEAVIREHEQFLYKPAPSLLDNISRDDLLEWDQDQEEPVESRAAPQTSSRTGRDSSRTQSRQDKVKTTARRKKVESTAAMSSPSGDGEDSSNFRNIENYLGLKDSQSVILDDDVMPAVANEMGSEAQIRFLKAKLRVMQEEMNRLSHELNVKDDNLRECQNKLKESEEAKNRLQRTNTAQTSQADKFKKLADEYKDKLNGLEVQLTAAKKESESLQRNEKQQKTSQSALEVRLNRALEECEKYKSQLDKLKTGKKDSVEMEKRRVDELLMENKRLEKQKNELMNGFKKQLKLIDIYKRQQMHLEAAKMLSFTEEEFVKTLEWGS